MLTALLATSSPGPAPAVLAAGLLNPALALGGLAAIAIPIIIHLLNRRRFRTVQWAAMDFLLQALRRNRRRMRFESWLLLATRCLVVGLLGVALARPFGCADTTLARVAGREAGLHVLILDNSASMAYRHERGDAPTHFEHARKLANALLARLSSGSEQVALVTAAEPARAVIGAPSYDLPAASQAIQATRQTSRATDLAGALERAVEIADQSPAGIPRTLHILTDSTASSLADAERLAEAARRASDRYDIVWHNLAAPGQSNQAVMQVRPNDALVRAGFDTGFTATIQRFGGLPAETNILWRLDGQGIGGSQVVTPGAEAEAVHGEQSIQDALGDGAPHVLEAALGGGDSFPGDDVRRRVVEQVRNLPVLLVEGGRSSGPLSSGLVLSLALQPSEESGYVQVTRISDLELAGRPLGDFRAVVLAGVGNLAEPTAQALADYVQAGGMLMVWFGEAVTADNYNAVMLPRGLVPGPLVQRIVAQNEDLIGFDFSPQNVHPYLDAFRATQRSGLDVPAIRQYIRLDLGEARSVDVVLRYLPASPGTPGDPAVTTHALGEGRVLVVTTAAGDPEWTLLPLKDNYVAFVHELLNHAMGDTRGGGVGWQTLEAGERLSVPASLEVTAEPSLTRPDGEAVELAREIRPDGTGIWVSRPLEEVGVYRLAAGDRSWPVAVNLPARESDLRPLDQPAVAAALGEIELQWLGDELPRSAEEEEARRADFGWSILLAVLLLASVECFMAMRFGRHRR